MPKEAVDRSFKFPLSKDPRRDPVIWAEACKKEDGFLKHAKSPAEYAAARSGNSMTQNRMLRSHIEKMNGDYLWVVERRDQTSPTAPPPQPPPQKTKASQSSAMAQLAMGVPDAETAFLRKRPSGEPTRVAYAALHPTVLPWQISVADPCFVNNEALATWTQRFPVQELPPMPVLPKRQPAEFVGPHAAALGAWRRGEVALSQWELSDRGDALVDANKIAEKLAHERAQQGLARLLKVTEKASRGRKPRWFEN